ncbi:MAG TPA: hypothetical protein VJM11_08160 [Nevskiaceae bacterium]|nr:hypothetical protein [Nevskiaceae bacterium]
MNPATAADYRAEYRARHIGPRYIGGLHFAFTTLGCVAIMAGCVVRLHGVTAWEWITVPVTLVFANLVEWYGHRGPMHHPRRGLGLLFERHVRQHHRFFTHERMAFDETRDFKAVLFPPVMLIFFFGAFALPVGLLLGLLATPNVTALFVLSAIGYFLNYELLHFAYHLPTSHWAARLPGIAFLRRHHTTHHDPSLMTHHNFNITYPVADWLFGTLRR